MRCLHVGTRHAGVEDMAFVGNASAYMSPFTTIKSLALLAACNVDGFVIPACYFAEETIDSEAFVAWVRYYLCPCLGNYAMAEPNSVLLLDNVNQHWSPEAIALIRARGTEIIFLPPYSPEVCPLSRLSAGVWN